MAVNLTVTTNFFESYGPLPQGKNAFMHTRTHKFLLNFMRYMGLSMDHKFRDPRLRTLIVHLPKL